MPRITVDPAQVEEIAAAMNSLNGKLNDTLEDSRDTIHGLKHVWSGEAADATVRAFDNFSKKYFETYREVINQYVKFLNDSVATGFSTVQKKNTSLSEAFD